MADWHVGQMVVCVEPDGWPPRWAALSARQIYTIRGIIEDDGVLGFNLEEIVNPINPFKGHEYGYRASRFRPVKATSIDCFQHLLTPTEHEGAATPSLPVTVTLPDDFFHDGANQNADCRELSLRIPAGSSPAGALAADLAPIADGRPLLHSRSNSSAKSLSACSQNSTRGFRNVGKFFQKSGK